MPSQEEFDELKGRIVELENALKGRAAAPSAADLTPEELATYHKVKAALGADSTYPVPCAPCVKCYPCYTCYVCHSCYCATECTCGPCIQAGAGGGAGRFGGLGA
ncbi:hypothetical protein ABIA35_001421 [Catenulispora sp. MAP12-49]|uniref:hypothetical protein n=1 Tax=Catenulispora sp. MAP12-49 TaxID=3156302 RepID=UPI0035170C43